MNVINSHPQFGTHRFVLNNPKLQNTMLTSQPEISFSGKGKPTILSRISARFSARFSKVMDNISNLVYRNLPESFYNRTGHMSKKPKQ